MSTDGSMLLWVSRTVPLQALPGADACAIHLRLLPDGGLGATQWTAAPWARGTRAHVLAQAQRACCDAHSGDNQQRLFFDELQKGQSTSTCACAPSEAHRVWMVPSPATARPCYS